jgi:hypothetical protein
MCLADTCLQVVIPMIPMLHRHRFSWVRSILMLVGSFGGRHGCDVLLLYMLEIVATNCLR